MIRKDAVKIIANHIEQNPIISANGFMSRDLFEVNDKESNFYMIGSMGLASSIGLGIALKNPKKKVFVFDGDGNILMNLGSLVTIGSLRPKNLVHLIFDNNIHESTGGQPTHSKEINISKIAKASNYTVFSVKTKKTLEKTLREIPNIHGPIFIHIHLSQGTKKSSRVVISPVSIKNRFMNAIN